MRLTKAVVGSIVFSILVGVIVFAVAIRDSAVIEDAAAQDTVVTIESHDIFFEPEEVSIPANTNMTISLPNEGAAPHNFSIDELDISVDLTPGETKEIVISAPPGTFEIYCNLPGHREAGMIAQLAVEAGQSSSTSTPIAGSPVAGDPSLVGSLEATIAAQSTVIAELEAQLAGSEIAASDTLLGELQATIETQGLAIADLESRVSALEINGELSEVSTPVDDAEPVETSDAIESQFPTASSSGDGTSLSGPLGFGQSGIVGEYEIRVIAVNTDAESEVLAASSSNEPAQAGNIMVMTTLEMTYLGNETGDPFWDLTYQVVGDRGLGYKDTGDAASCGREPLDLMDAPEMFPGGTTTVNVCWQVPLDEVNSLVLVLEPLFSSGEMAFFEIV